MTADTCPTCGSPVRIVSSDEGTSHFEPPAIPTADVLRDLLWAVNQLPTVPGDYSNVVGPSGRGPFVSLPAIREAIDARLAAQPEPSAPEGLDVERLARALRKERSNGSLLLLTAYLYPDRDTDRGVLLTDIGLAREMVREDREDREATDGR